MKKIDIYYRGEYICSTKQAKTCKEAIENFKLQPYYPLGDCFCKLSRKYKPNYMNDIENNCLDFTKLKAFFDKSYKA